MNARQPTAESFTNFTDLLTRAIDCDASSIHLNIDQFPDRAAEASIEFRIGGKLKHVAEVTTHSITALTKDCKEHAAREAAKTRDLKGIGETYSTTFTVDDRRIHVSVSHAAEHYLPVSQNLKSVTTVFHLGVIPSGRRTLVQLGFVESQAQLLEQVVSAPSGLTLVTGPSGAGKTTTADALARIGNRKAKVVAQARIAFTNHNRSHEPKFIVEETNRLIKEALMADPDLLVVDGIGDASTAEIIFNAVLDGHAVIATMTAGSPCTALVKLTRMGVPLYALAAPGSINAIVNQRLLPTIDGAGATVCASVITFDAEMQTRILEGQIGEALRYWDSGQLGGPGDVTRMRKNADEKAAAGLVSPQDVDAIIGKGDVL